MSNIYSYAPFGYEGALCLVEVDLRRGIPAVDIVGLADGAVKETRERVRAAIANSGFEFPAERVLISLSPADMRKEGAGFDLPVALEILNAQDEFIEKDVLAFGELELSGNIRPVRGVHAAVATAKAAGINRVICCEANMDEVNTFSGIEIICANNLKKLVEKIKNDEYTDSINIQLSDEVQFNRDSDEDSRELYLKPSLVKAITIAIAGKHNLLLTGRPGCGKSMAVDYLIPALNPLLTEEESNPTTRIWSLAGLNKYKVCKPPFRMPHQTATIEGICGGGVYCRPGEISLAHNGVLFLDEAAEFRTSVLQMLRVPLETKHITLSRAGRSTIYPANFQLIMATNPCPCGNYGSNDKLCLCSAKSIDMYWKKFSDPLIDRMAMRWFIDEDEKSELVNLEELRAKIKTAREIQKGTYNNDITPDVLQYVNIDKEAVAILDKKELTPRERLNMIRVAKTIANIDGRYAITVADIKEALSYNNTVFNWGE